jgi:hypothetical protein
MMAMQQSTDTDQPFSHSSGPTVASQVMQSIFGLVPHAWQEDVISHIFALAKDHSCAPLLLVQPTGGGKSAVRDTVGVILAGVVLTISPLLSLAADQTDKVTMQASKEFGNVLSFHLDEIKDRVQKHFKPWAGYPTDRLPICFPSSICQQSYLAQTIGFNYPEEVVAILFCGQDSSLCQLCLFVLTRVCLAVTSGLYFHQGTSTIAQVEGKAKSLQCYCSSENEAEGFRLQAR